uniref:Multifunctional fusion protein n=1 Tax=Hirondellea gigas TaxID=1518452 RepID=A0A6A7GCR6_9CRUS
MHRLSGLFRSTRSTHPGQYFCSTVAMGGLSNLPSVSGEHMLNYAPGCPERAALKKALSKMKTECPEIPCVIGGREIFTGAVKTQVMPSRHSHAVCTFHEANEDLIRSAIENSRQAKKVWELTPFEDRSAIFLKAAELMALKFRPRLCAAVMLGTGKNVWQAEIDAAAEAVDFLRFAPTMAQEVYALQPVAHSKGVWNRQVHRPLEGFVAAISPFNFCAIGVNLPSTPAIMGNVALWKPASTSVLGNYITFQILREAGLPDGVINFLPCSGQTFGDTALTHPDLAGVHFTGSTGVFHKIWNLVSENISRYVSYPRLVGETGGKNFHFVHSSADVSNVVHNTIRGAFEYQGQKCSACSRLYVPSNLWPEIKQKLLQEISQIKMGQPDTFDVFMTAVIDQKSYNNAKSYIDYARESDDYEILIGGDCDDSEGYFVSPTLIETTNPSGKLMREEIFAPVLTVFVYPEDEYIETLELCSHTSPFGLTGAIFAKDRYAVRQAMLSLKNAAGNFYINDKCTGAVVGEQPFGGARKSGTNDKAGSVANYYRWVSSQTIKETYSGLEDWKYPHMEQEI